jgi:hypothetical protein
MMTTKNQKQTTKPLASEAKTKPPVKACAVEPLARNDHPGQSKKAAMVTEIRKSSLPVAQPIKRPTLPVPIPPPAKAAVAKAPLAPAPLRVSVSFVLPEPAAKRVSLSGEFNGWAPDATPMTRQENGHWQTIVDLAPGRYQYKYIVDGEWQPDPLAAEHVWNPHGTLNSVVEVRA